MDMVGHDNEGVEFNGRKPEGQRLPDRPDSSTRAGKADHAVVHVAKETHPPVRNDRYEVRAWR